MSNADLIERLRVFAAECLKHGPVRAALLTDAADALAAQEWQTMDMAPKDGTPIWAYLYDSGIRLVQWVSAEESAASRIVRCSLRAPPVTFERLALAASSEPSA